MKGASYNQNESDYYGMLDDILEVEYHSRLGRCVVVVFKCTWFNPVQGVRVDQKHKLVDINHTKKGCFDDPFILASQAQQVYYLPYPSMKDWWAVVKTSPRGIYELSEDVSVVEDDDNVAGDHFLQENERLDFTSTNEDIEPFPFQQGYVEEVVNEANDDDNQDDEDEDKLEENHLASNDDFELIYEEDESD